jgi:hypothetical protein
LALYPKCNSIGRNFSGNGINHELFSKRRSVLEALAHPNTKSAPRDRISLIIDFSKIFPASS